MTVSIKMYASQVELTIRLPTDLHALDSFGPNDLWCIYVPVDPGIRCFADAMEYSCSHTGIKG